MFNLSVFIPTYNREFRLLNQLESLLKQDLSDEIMIYVLNNHSDYDVEKAIEERFGPKSSNITVINNKSNLGLSLNIALPFYYCKTKWLWILSDDDITLPDSLKRIKDDTEEYTDYACLKYSLKYMSQHENDVFTSLEQLVSYYSREDKNQGEFIFISNNLFNMEKIEPYIGKILNYSYNAVAGILPYVYVLDSKSGKVIMRNHEIVSYLPPEKGKEWNYVDITSRLITLTDYPYNSDGETVRKLINLMNHFSFYDYMAGLIKLNDKEKVRMQISKTFPLLFQNGIMRRTLYKTVYYAYLWLNIDGVKIRKRIGRQNNK